MTTNETIPQHVRRLAAEYVGRFHGSWNTSGRHWLKFAFVNGYRAACAEQAAEVAAIEEALDRWEVDGDDEQLVTDVIDPWLEKIRERARDHSSTKAAQRAPS